MIEPRLEDLAPVARAAEPSALEAALASEDAALRAVAVTAEWYAARASDDTERRTRATAALFEAWRDHRPAARLLRVVGAGLAEEGWPAASVADVERRLARMGDRDAVLARAAAVAEAEDAPPALLAEALRGVNLMAIRHDREALVLAERLLRRLGETTAAVETVLFRAELGDADALARLGAGLAGIEGCAERGAFVGALFGP
jgi:hypothetical protein